VHGVCIWFNSDVFLSKAGGGWSICVGCGMWLVVVVLGVILIDVPHLK
jgi:hypothetical protein